VPPTLELTAAELAIVLEILDRHVPEREVWAFGSRVGGRVKPFSDLDLTVVGEVPLSMAQLGDVREAFDESDLPFRVDVGDWASTDDAFRAIIRERYLVLKTAVSPRR
jgi:predicted nucleotidyltransferase